jgi:hypothetical protein
MKLWIDHNISVIHGLDTEGISICEYGVSPRSEDAERVYIGTQEDITCPKCIVKLEHVTKKQMQLYIDRIATFGDPDNFSGFEFMELFNQTFLRRDLLEKEFKEISDYVRNEDIDKREELIQYGKLKILIDLLGYEPSLLEALFNSSKVYLH